MEKKEETDNSTREILAVSPSDISLTILILFSRTARHVDGINEFVIKELESAPKYFKESLQGFVLRFIKELKFRNEKEKIYISKEFVFAMQNNFKTINGLFNHFNDIQRCVKFNHLRHSISPTSLIGLYFRKVHLHFEELSFIGIKKLHCELIKYMNEVAVMHSTYKVSKYLTSLTKQIESDIISFKQNQSQSLLSISKHIKLLGEEIGTNNEAQYYKIYYIKYLLGIKNRNFQSAVKNLHKYFDLCYSLSWLENSFHTGGTSSTMKYELHYLNQNVQHMVKKGKKHERLFFSSMRGSTLEELKNDREDLNDLNYFDESGRSFINARLRPFRNLDTGQYLTHNNPGNEFDNHPFHSVIQNMSQFVERKDDRYFMKLLRKRRPFASVQRFMVPSYGSLHKAALHFHFSNFDSAKRCVIEAIIHAQEMMEDECLALALAWLYKLENKQREIKANDLSTLVKRCVKRSKILNINEMLAQSLIFSAQLLMKSSTVDVVVKSEQFEGLDVYDLDSFGRKLQKKMTTAKLFLSLKVKSPVLSGQMEKKIDSTYAEVWESLGNEEMVSMYTNAIDVRECSIETAVNVLCKRGLLELRRSGNYERALLYFRQIFSHNFYMSCNVKLTFYFIYFDKVKYLCEISNMKNLLKKMKQNVTQKDNENYIEVLLRESEYNIRIRNINKAKQCAIDAREGGKYCSLKIPYVKATRLYAMCFMENAEAIDYTFELLMEGYTIVKNRCMEHEKARYSLLFAKIFILKDDPLKAMMELDKIFSFVSQNGEKKMIADLNYLYGICIFNRSEKDNKEAKHYDIPRTNVHKAACKKAFTYFKEAAKSYKIINDLKGSENAWFWIARVFNGLGNESERNKSSKMCLSIRSKRIENEKKNANIESFIDDMKITNVNGNNNEKRKIKKVKKVKKVNNIKKREIQKKAIKNEIKNVARRGVSVMIPKNNTMK